MPSPIDTRRSPSPTADAAPRTSTPASPARQDAGSSPTQRTSAPGLPEPRRSASPTQRPRVSILGFGSDHSLQHPPAGMPQAHPYRVTGHVALSVDGGRTIIGFGPELPPDLASGEGIKRLLKRETFPGKLSDDTAVFRDVHDRPMAPGSSAYDMQTVYKKDIPVSREHFEQIKSALDKRDPMPETRYGFPYKDSQAFNCATYPSSLGVPLPHPKGGLDQYIPALKEQGQEWEPPK